jgi:hypothetical protein
MHSLACLLLGSLQTLAAPIPVAAETTTLPATIDTLLAQLQLRPEGNDPSNRVRVIIGDFPCNNAGSEGFSTVSRVLEDEFGAAVTRRKDIELVTREKLGALLEEKKLGDLNFLDPRTAPTRISLKAAELLVRGHYIYSYPFISLKVESIRLHGGTVVATLTAQASLGLFPNVDVLPKNPSSALADKVLPQKIVETKTNRESVEAICQKLPNRDISVQLWVTSGRTHFQEGEKITFAVRAAKDCHIAVFCHQIDGSTVVLFPNRHSGNTRIQKDTVVGIPGEEKEKFYIEITPPFGGDIVQVIASTRKSALASIVNAAQPMAGSPYATLSRGVITRGMQVVGSGEGSDSDDDVTAPGPTQYGETHVIINTYPK